VIFRLLQGVSKVEFGMLAAPRRGLGQSGLELHHNLLGITHPEEATPLI